MPFFRTFRSSCLRQRSRQCIAYATFLLHVFYLPGLCVHVLSFQKVRGARDPLPPRLLAARASGKRKDVVYHRPGWRTRVRHLRS